MSFVTCLSILFLSSGCRVSEKTAIGRNTYSFQKNVVVENLGAPVNTAKLEYGPQFGPEGKWFYITRGGDWEAQHLSL